MTRREMIIAVEQLVTFWPGFYVASDTEVDVHQCDTFCHEHAEALAAINAVETGVVSWASSTSLGVDSYARCAVGGCERDLNCGGLTDWGVNSALGLTETDPLACHVYPGELVQAAWSMLDDDSRWTTWEAHARRMLAEKARKR